MNPGKATLRVVRRDMAGEIVQTWDIQIKALTDLVPSLPSVNTIAPSIKNPGDLFALIIFKITGQHTANCGVCGRRKKQMNEWGWLGCWRNRKTIIAWLCEEAAKRGHKIDKASMTVLFKAAWKELKQNRLAASSQK